MTDRVTHARDVTGRLRDDEPPMGLSHREAICPRCSLAFHVRESAFDWGVCPDCLADAVVRLEPIPTD